MNKVKSYKLITLLLILATSLIFAFGLVTGETAFAATNLQPSQYFKYEESVGTKVSAIKFADDKAVLPMQETEKVAFYRSLIVDDFEMVFEAPMGEVEKFSVNVPMSSYIVTGNKNQDGGYDKTIENEIVFEPQANGLKVTLNGVEEIVDYDGSNNDAVKLNVSFNNNVIKISVNGNEIDQTTDDYYKVKIADKPFSTISFETASIVDGVSEISIKLVSIDTKVSDTSDEYVQTFVLSSDGKGFYHYARPRYSVNEGFINNGVVTLGEEYTVTTTAYSFTGTSTTCYLVSDETDVIVKGTTKKSIKFATEGEKTFYIGIVNTANTSSYIKCEEYAVTVKAEGDNAPVYKENNDAALESYKAELNKKLYQDFENKVFINLGKDKYLELPSMESLVSDDVSGYKNLTYTIFYSGPDGDSSYSTSLKIPVEKAGKYVFYVAFKDKAGNAMTSEQFIVKDSIDSNIVKPNDDGYGKFVFEVELKDNADMTAIERKQGTAYVGVQYKATNFDVQASENTKSYSLFYRATENDEWMEIVKASTVTDETLDYNGFTYDQIKEIAYEGELTFMPHATGFYKIELLVNSTSSTRWTAAETIIECVKPQSVTPVVIAKDVNVAQVVFLSVGSVCLIGIIALFFVKPKDKKED